MKEKTLGIILGILNMALLILCLFFYLGKDRNPPRIQIREGELQYRQGMEEEVLLSMATAWDEESGDLTAGVVVEKVVTDRKAGTATITYGVADQAGNVDKVSHTVRMEEEPEEPGDSQRQETVSEEAGEVLPPSQEREPEGEAEPGEEETGEEETVDLTAQALPTAGEAGNTTQTVSSQQDEGRPSMVLKSREVKVKAGNMPAWVEVVEGLHDDRDDYETLLQSLTLHGEYDINKAGTYAVTVTVTDREGKESNAYPLTLIVEE